MQSLQPVALPSFWKVPALHGVHEAERASGAAVPRLHVTGAVEPVLQLLPGGHCSQPTSDARSMRVEKVPAGQGSAALAPKPQYEPALHGMHAVLPLPSWYLPGPQREHVAMPRSTA